MDELDIKLLNLLLVNSRLSSRDLAKETGVSIVTVLKRVKALEAGGVIKSYSADFDYEKIGYDVSIMVKLRIAKGRLFDVEKKIAVDSHVFAVYDITGDFDAVVLAKFKSRKSMDSFLKKIQTYDFVERTETNLILNTIKESRTIVE